MANQFYDKGREAFAQGRVNWNTNDIRLILVNLANYTFSHSHARLSDVPSAARVATQPLTNKTSVGGALDADNVLFTNLTGGTVGAIIIYKHDSADANTELLFFFDTISGLPYTPSGGDLEIVFDDGPNKIARI